VGLFAIEQRRVVGQVFVMRIPYTFRDGIEPISGIVAVGTRPDRGRSGVARTVLTEVHRRERDAGVRYATLWTNRSWGAHGLYEKLGYRDVYSAPWAVHSGGVSRSAPSGPVRVRAARRSDLRGIERLHVQASARRLGFTPRVPEFLRVAVATREVDPAKELLVAERDGRLEGYAHVDRNPYRSVCGELVATSATTRRRLVGAVARTSHGAPYAFQHSPVVDSPTLFAGPGFSTSPRSWYGLMALDLRREWTAREAVQRLATDDQRFLCMSGDRF
jgi:hypothetical protein